MSGPLYWMAQICFSRACTQGARFEFLAVTFYNQTLQSFVLQSLILQSREKFLWVQAGEIVTGVGRIGFAVSALCVCPGQL